MEKSNRSVGPSGLRSFSWPFPWPYAHGYQVYRPFEPATHEAQNSYNFALLNTTSGTNLIIPMMIRQNQGV